jgi:hypothetical protein
MKTLQRDPFARGEYVRFTITAPAHSETCAWCGNSKLTHEFQKSARFYRYAWWSDDKKAPADPGGPVFCNFDCFRTYHS